VPSIKHILDAGLFVVLSGVVLIDYDCVLQSIRKGFQAAKGIEPKNFRDLKSSFKIVKDS
jgi:hypothetical protein